MTYGIASDLHCHRWSLFSTIEKDGVNSRLRTILNELRRLAQTVLDAGGSTIVIPGDIMHVRGSIDPEVLNPVQECFREIMDLGMSIIFIPGNHDLAGKETTMLGSAVQTLSETFSALGSIRAINEPLLMPDALQGEKTAFAFVPWCSTTEAMMKAAETLALQAVTQGIIGQTDLFIHAGIDGVLDHMPAHGLTARRLAALGFRNVFAGHYHNYKDLGEGVVSVGASTHQTWSDLNSIAGFLIVDEAGKHVHHASNAPNFVDVTGLDEDEMAAACYGNYVRFRGDQMAMDDINEFRKFFVDSGALGTSIQVVKAAISNRTANPTKTGATLDESVTSYIDAATDIPAHVDKDEVKRHCSEVLATSRAVHEEA